MSRDDAIATGGVVFFIFFAVCVTAIIVVTVLAVRRSIAARTRQLAELAGEAVVLDSGRRGIWVTARRLVIGRLVLTSQRLIVVTTARISLDLDIRLPGASFKVTDGSLSVSSAGFPRTRPARAFVCTVPELESWIQALTAAGAAPDAS